MNRKIAIALLAASLTPVLPTGAALAAPPSRSEPLGDYRFVLNEHETPCGAFLVDVHDGERITVKTDRSGAVRSTTVHGSLRMRIESVESGAAIELNVPGPGAFADNGDITGAGPWFLYGSNILAYTTGKLLLPGGDPNLAIVKGRRVDLCPILNPDHA